MKAISMFYNSEGQSHKTVSTDHNFWSERRAEADSNRGPSAFQHNALPLGQIDSRNQSSFEAFINRGGGGRGGGGGRILHASVTVSGTRCRDAVTYDPPPPHHHHPPTPPSSNFWFHSLANVSTQLSAGRVCNTGDVGHVNYFRAA